MLTFNVTDHSIPKAASRGTRPKYLITIDTEGDHLWSRPEEITTRNAWFLPRFQSVCERNGLKPTYLTNYEMARCPVFREFARDVLRRGAGEVGMHLHAWNSPPLVARTDDDHEHHPYLMEFPEPLLRDKIAFMTDLLEDTFDVPIVSHRAGRWGFDEVYARALIDRGYLVDCSVTPLVSWRTHRGAPDGKGGPDYRTFPAKPYFLDPTDIRCAGRSPLLELPMTIISPSMPFGRELRSLVAGGPRMFRAPVHRLLPPVAWLRPNGSNLRSMLAIQRRAVDEGADHAEFMLHSSEFMPGGSPTFRDERAIEVLYEHLEALFEAAGRLFDGATLQDFYWHHSDSRARATRIQAVR